MSAQARSIDMQGRSPSYPVARSTQRGVSFAREKRTCQNAKHERSEISARLRRKPKLPECVQKYSRSALPQRVIFWDGGRRRTTEGGWSGEEAAGQGGSET